MSKLIKKIANWFNSMFQKLGHALQDEKTVNNYPVEEKQKRETETAKNPQQVEITETQQPVNTADITTQMEVVETTQQEETVKTHSQTTATQHQKKQEDKKETEKGEKTVGKEEKSLDNKEKLMDHIISTLNEQIDYLDATKGKKLIIWLDCDEGLVFKNYNTDSYRQQMLSFLVNEKGYGFEKLEFRMGKPAAELKASKVKGNDFEYLQVIEDDIVPKPMSCKAIISIYGEAGSLVQDKYILSPEDMKEKMIDFYNIGAGKFPRIPTGYRENHIAIDDNPESPMVEKNQYVSRTHARIGFSDKFGFYLQVEKDGSRLMGKRTRIFRNGADKPIECENPQAKIPLQDGDLIELGKAVVLRYKQLNEE